MTHPPRVVSSRVSWLITIVLSLTGALAYASTCDVDADGDIDRKDYLAILADIGERASGPNDPRDADRNGRILSNDAQLCARRCTLPLCNLPTTKPPSNKPPANKPPANKPPTNKAPIAKNDAATTARDTPVRTNVIANDRDRDGRMVPRTVTIVTKPQHGKARNHRDGTVTYSPAQGFRGRDSFRYRVTDNDGATSNGAWVRITVKSGNGTPVPPPGNVPPVANNDSAGTTVNTPVTINVVANDTDPNGNLDPASVAIVSNPANGGVVNNLDGTVTYTPAGGFFGTDSFTYNVMDTQGATSNTATVTVGVNAAPTADAGPDANAVTGQSVTLDGSASSDPNGDMLTFSWRFMSVPLASALVDADIVNPTIPAPRFTPDVDGAYELELTATDPGGLSNTDTVIITAATPNVAPNANAGPDQNADVLTLVTMNGSGSNDADNGPSPLTFQWAFAQVPLGSALSNADIANATTANASFTPDVIGLYRLTLTVSDSDLSDSDDVDINVTVPNVSPNANAGLDSVVQLGPPGQTATLDGTGSNDPDNGPVAPLMFQWTFASMALGSTLTDADIQNANTDTANFTPDVPGVFLVRLDVFDGEDTHFDEVMVTANAAPVAADDAFNVNEDTPATIGAPGVLGSDTDANNDALMAALVSGPNNAQSFTLNPDGSFDYTPNADFFGADSFTYKANDGSADSNTATVAITVNAANDPPVAVADPSYTTDEDGGALAGTSVLANDTDAENDTLTAVLDTGPTNDQSFNLNSDGTFNYTPNADFFGPDTFTYHANDGNSDSNVAMVTITVNEVNDAPSFIATNPPAVNEDAGAQTVNSWATFNPGPANESGQTVMNYTVSNPSNAALFSTPPAVDTNGNLTYAPAANANGTSTFDVTVKDNGGTANGGVDTSPVQTFTITVNAVNDAPSFIATNPPAVNEDAGAQTVNSWATFNPGPANESGQTVMNYTVSNPSNAALFSTPPAVDTNGNLTYAPAANANGTSTFDVTVKDNGGTANGGVDTSPVQTFTITVNAVNDAPSFTKGFDQTVLEDAGLVTVNPWATGVSGGPANESSQTVGFNITGNTNSGLFSAGPAVSPAGVLTFIPAPNAFGSATITLVLQDSGGTANDGVDTSGSQSFSINVTPVNDAPVATAKSHQTHSGIRITIGAGDTGRLKDGAADVDDPFSDLSVSSSFGSITPAGATVTLIDAGTGTFSYNPPAGYSGPASFEFQVCDDGIPTAPVLCSTPATVSFTITGPDLWFVDDGAGAGGTGRLADPFDALSDVPATRGTGDRIFVFSGTYGGHTLLTNEHLIGEGSSGSFDTALGVTVPGNGTLDSRPALGGTRPQLGGTITVGANSTVRGLNIVTNGTTGLTGNNFGTLTASEVSVTGDNGAAINLVTGNLAATFTRISSTGGSAPGINLSGTTGTFTVTGNAGSCTSAATCTGGSISGKTGAFESTGTPGIRLNNVSNIRLSFMNISGNNHSGVYGTTANGFQLGNCLIENNGDNTVSNPDETGVDIANLTGTAIGGANPTSINNTIIRNNKEFELQITNSSGTLTDFQMNNDMISSNNNNTLDAHGNLVNFLALGTANMTLNLVGGSYTGNANPNGTTATAVQCDHSGTSGTATCNLSGATFTNNNVAVSVSQAQGGNLRFNVTGNTATGNRSHGLNLFVAAIGTGTVDGSFTNNTVGTLNTADSGSNLGQGIRIQNEGSSAGAPPVNVLISGNTVQEMTNFAGINLNQGIAAQAATRATNATITNNVVREVDNNRAIIVQQNNTTAPGSTCADISGNNMSNIAGNIGDGTKIRFRQLAGGTFNVRQQAPTAAANALELDDANSVGANVTTPTQISIGGAVTFNAGACPLP